MHDSYSFMYAARVLSFLRNVWSAVGGVVVAVVIVVVVCALRLLSGSCIQRLRSKFQVQLQIDKRRSFLRIVGVAAAAAATVVAAAVAVADWFARSFSSRGSAALLRRGGSFSALRYFLARELQQRGQLRLAYVASEANTADIFTKALPPGDHQRFCTMLGLVPTWPHLLTS
ncbi:unnamed protein product [Closterium sp. NIES-54]